MSEQPILSRGWRYLYETVDHDLIKYVIREAVNKGITLTYVHRSCDFVSCLNCEKKLREGEKVLVVYDKKNRRKGIYCTSRCQRAYHLEKAANNRIENKKLKNKLSKLGW